MKRDLGQRRTGWTAGALAAAMFLFAPVAGAEEPLTPEQKLAVETVIHDYLLEHPEIIVEAVKKLDERQAGTQAKTQKQAIADNRVALFEQPGDPVGGNPKGGLTMVEFFDYRCPYCKTVSQPLMETIAADGDLRIVFKEYPILGPESEFAAQAALAAQAQGKYAEFHLALMGFKGKLNNDLTLKVAAEIGLDVERLKRDMAAPEITEALARNYKLAMTLGISGTPAFVVGNRLIPGAVAMDEMKAVVAEERKGG